MDDQRFWAIVAAARDAAGDDVDDRVTGLEETLLSLHADEVQAFQDVYDEMLQRANTWALWGAASVMMGGCSDDAFRYFRDWLISEGEAVFEAALNDPESLAALPEQDEPSLEGFGDIAAEVFEQMTDTEVERRAFLEGGEPSGTPWEQDDLPGRFPRLSARYPG